jgi:putative transposase
MGVARRRLRLAVPKELSNDRKALPSATPLVAKVCLRSWMRTSSSSANLRMRRHGRMHLTLKLETTKPAGANFLQRQAKFDAFIAEFNTERPHQALGQKPPVAFYTSSKRAYKGLPELDYPIHDKSVIVTTSGRICFNTRKINLSQVFAGQRVGIKQVEDRLWLVSFMDYDLGYFDDTECRLEPLDNPFGAKLLPMSSE